MNKVRLTFVLTIVLTIMMTMTVRAEEDVQMIPSQVVINRISSEEIDLICKMVYSEARGESELGKRLVVDTVLNRIDSLKYGYDITEIIKQKGQYTYYCPVDIPEDIRSIVVSELYNRTNYEVMYFRTGDYHTGHIAVCHEGAHYFSK